MELLKQSHCLLAIKLNFTSVNMRKVLPMKEFKSTVKYVYEQVHRLYF